MKKQTDCLDPKDWFDKTLADAIKEGYFRIELGATKEDMKIYPNKEKIKEFLEAAKNKQKTN